MTKEGEGAFRGKAKKEKVSKVEVKGNKLKSAMI